MTITNPGLSDIGIGCVIAIVNLNLNTHDGLTMVFSKMDFIHKNEKVNVPIEIRKTNDY